MGQQIPATRAWSNFSCTPPHLQVVRRNKVDRSAAVPHENPPQGTWGLLRSEHLSVVVHSPSSRVSCMSMCKILHDCHFFLVMGSTAQRAARRAWRQWSELLPATVLLVTLVIVVSGVTSKAIESHVRDAVSPKVDSSVLERPVEVSAQTTTVGSLLQHQCADRAFTAARTCRREILSPRCMGRANWTDSDMDIPVSCRAGFFRLSPSTKVPAQSRDVAPCCPGFACPMSAECMVPCEERGSACVLADETRTPQAVICELHDLTNLRFTGDFHYGCGGAHSKDEFCPRGRYCPDSARVCRCPVGYFCPAGFSMPLRCSSFWSSCDPGSSSARPRWPVSPSWWPPGCWHSSL